MCGIAGRINLFSERPVDSGAIEEMCAWIRHRGPDDQDIRVDGFAGFGHRRLAVIDLSPGGRQPMVSRSGRYWIVFNGEIYNHGPLRRELESRGARFRSTSDTEVLLAAFEAYGPECLSRLRGMFAFAIWDVQERQLFLARDRVGKKPLYYRTDGDGLSFASETKAFFADPGFSAAPNHQALSAFLALQYVPSPLSAFQHVHALPPAHYLIAKSSGVTVRRYWQLEYDPKSEVAEATAEEQLLEHIRDAVRLRMISDVPLGAFLSGGIDSSVVVALMCELGGQGGRVRTFSIGFDDAAFNELPYARMVANRLGTDHHEFVVRPDARDLLPQLVWHYGEPFGDSSAIPTFYLSKLTRAHVTVALNGDGGDENLAGYDRYAVSARNAAYARVPIGIRRMAGGLTRALPAFPDRRLGRLRRWARTQAAAPSERAALERMLIDPAWKGLLCTREFLAAAGTDAAMAHLSSAYAGAAAIDPLDRLLAMDFATYLPGALMPKVDIATMAFGLEGRSPLLDHELMQFCARLPAPMKRNGLEGKRLLRRIAGRFIPAEAVNRPKKGFSVPLAGWFRHELADMVDDVVLGSRARARGFVQSAAAASLVHQHRAGTHDWHEQIWLLLMLELWAREYLDQRPRPSAQRDWRLVTAS